MIELTYKRALDANEYREMQEGKIETYETR